MIPKLGAFFVHDDRSGGPGSKAAGGKLKQQGGGGDGVEGSPQGEGEEEEAGLGRWRADALPPTKKKTGVEPR